MPSTVKFHSEKFQIPQNWQSLTSDRADFRKFSEVMSLKVCAEKTLQIVAMSAATFGLYLVYLTCSNKGRIALNHLRKRQIIHYVKLKRNEQFQLDGKIPNFQQKAIAKVEEVRIKLPENEIKAAVQEVRGCQKLMKEMLDIVREKRGIFMDQLADLAKDRETKLMLAAVEKFLSLRNESQTSLNFLKYLAAFLINAKNLEAFKLSLSLANQIQAKDISEAEKVFISFEKAYSDLDQDQKLDWFFFILDKNYYREIYEIMSSFHYSAAFIRIYKHNPSVILNQIIPSLKNFERMDEEREELKKEFIASKILAHQLTENLAEKLEDSSCLVFSIKDALEDNKIKTFVEEFLLSVKGLNSPDHIKFFDYCASQKLDLLALEEVVETHREAAIDKCQMLLEEAKRRDIEEKEKLARPEIIRAFEKMKKLFENYRDTLKLSREVHCLLKAKNRNSKVMDCLEKLSKFSFNGLRAPSGLFCREFSQYFDLIEEMENQLKIMQEMEVD